MFFKQFCKEATDRQLQFDKCPSFVFAGADGWRFVVSEVATSGSSNRV